MLLYPKNGRHEMIVFQLSVNRPIINIKPINISIPPIPKIENSMFGRLRKIEENNNNWAPKGITINGWSISEGFIKSFENNSLSIWKIK